VFVDLKATSVDSIRVEIQDELYRMRDQKVPMIAAVALFVRMMSIESMPFR
jgi:hypothetical protein